MKDKSEDKKPKKKVGWIETKLERNSDKKPRRLSKFLYEYSLNHDDELIEEKDLNVTPYTKALRVDKRSLCKKFLYTIANKIEIINIFYYKNTYVHLSMSISLYLFSFLLDVTLNCFLYTDDVVQKNIIMKEV